MVDLAFLGLKLDEIKRVQRRIERLEYDVLLFAQQTQTANDLFKEYWAEHLVTEREYRWYLFYGDTESDLSAENLAQKIDHLSALHHQQKEFLEGLIAMGKEGGENLLKAENELTEHMKLIQTYVREYGDARSK